MHLTTYIINNQELFFSCQFKKKNVSIFIFYHIMKVSKFWRRSFKYIILYIKIQIQTVIKLNVATYLTYLLQLRLTNNLSDSNVVQFVNQRCFSRHVPCYFIFLCSKVTSSRGKVACTFFKQFPFTRCQLHVIYK